VAKKKAKRPIQGGERALFFASYVAERQRQRQYHNDRASMHTFYTTGSVRDAAEFAFGEVNFLRDQIEDLRSAYDDGEPTLNPHDFVVDLLGKDPT
jgi:hypothetical protein